jgi:hypothetical protein
MAGESVGRGGLARRAFDAMNELVVGLFRSGSRLVTARRNGNPQL